MNLETAPLALLFCALLTTACGNADIEQLVGTWRYTDGSSTLTCPDGSESAPATGTVRFEEGIASDLVFYAEDGSCVLGFSAGPDGAQIEPGDRCTGRGHNNGVDYTWSLVPTTWRFDISSDGRRINEFLIATLRLEAGGQQLSCTIQGNGILEKVSR
jgi:hypothetical protein